MSFMSYGACAILILAAAPGVGKTKGEPEAPASAELLLADGSRVQATVLDQAFEVITRFGKLTVPVGEIRRIDFSLRPESGTAVRIREAIASLGSGSFDQREQATRQLVHLGTLAVLPLESAARSDSPEVAERVQAALTRIRESVSTEGPQPLASDRVYTPDFVVVGRISAAAVRVRTSYFGEVDLKVGDLRCLRFLKGGVHRELSVDAARYGTQEDSWLNTEIAIEAGSRLDITAGGEVDLWSDGSRQYLTGPDGYQGSYGSPGSGPPGTLLGRIGENGTVFVIGRRYQGIAAGAGTLYLRIVPSPWNNPSSGSYTVKVESGW